MCISHLSPFIHIFTHTHTHTITTHTHTYTCTHTHIHTHTHTTHNTRTYPHTHTGQERFQSITNRFYQDTHAVLIIYDVTSEESFHDVDFWVREVQYYLPQELDDGMPVIFAGNKKDLIDKSALNQKTVNFRQVQEIANAYGFLKPIECSAKTGENVKKIFVTLATELLRRRKQHVTTIVPTSKHKCCLTG